MVITAISAIVVFGIIVLVHEWGHFITAKMTGMRVDEFAIGFGPRLFGWTRGETKYSLRCVPLGGYNKIAGMTKEEDEDPDYEYGPAYDRAYYRRPLWARMVVILAGSFMNLITPIFLFWGLFFFVGVDVPSGEPVIGEVVENMPAAQAGLMKGDKLLVIDGVPINNWSDIRKTVSTHQQEVHSITYERNGVEETVKVTPIEKEGRLVVGIIGVLDHMDVGFFESIAMAVEHNFSMIARMLEGIGGFFTGASSSEDLSGPIGVLQMTGKVAQMGIIPLISFGAMLSLNLGIVNLLPVPILDGGHFVTLCLEGLRGKPLGERAHMIVNGFGLALLISLMLFATMNDITR